MSRDWHGAGQPRGFPQQQRGGPPQQMQPQQYMQQQMQPPNQQQMQQQMQQPYQQMQQQMYPPQMQPRQGYAPPQMQMQPPMQMHDPFSAAPRRSPKRRGASQPPAAARQPEMYDPYAAYSIDDYAPPEDAPSVSSVEQALAAALREKKQQVSPDAGQLALKAAQDTMRQIAADLAQKRSLQQQPAAAEKLASAAPPLVASEPSPVVAAPPASQSEDHGAFRAAAMADVGEAVSTPPEAVSTPPVRSNGPGLQKKRLPPALPPLSAVGPKRTRLVAVEEDAAGKSVFDGLLAVGPIAAEPPKEPVPPVPPAARAPPINAPGFAAAAVAKVAAPPAAAAPATPPVEAPAEAAPPANAEMDALLGPAAPTEPVAETQMDVEAPHEVPRVEAPRVDEAPVDEAARAQPPQKEAKAECGDVRPMDDAEAPADCDTMALDSAADSFALDYTPNAAPSDATATSDTHVASEADAEDASPEPDDAGDAAMSDDVEPTADGVEPAAENVVADSTEAASDAPSACVAAAEPFSGADGAPEEAASEGRASTGLWADLEDELLDRAPASHEEEALDDAFSAVIGGRDLECAQTPRRENAHV
ncbi:hypothetical protein M885DRAFT_38610 [Pelagophyceae sp. CCMP2097]|nr:hypothetical protein M885DRAFT_38610 [Pelagophyceae sp. CCMP2097]